ncbi:hypothetical protein ACHAWF_008721 [Thalassiosira exigua]
MLADHCLLAAHNHIIHTIHIRPNSDPFERNVAAQDGAKQYSRRAQNVSASASNYESAYEPLRVQFDTHLLDALSSTFPSHVALVRNALLPSLLSFWSEALSVIPAQSIEVSFQGRCALEIKELGGYVLDDFLQYSEDDNRVISNIGSNGSVEMSQEGDSLVYNDVDLVIVVVPVQGTTLCPADVSADAESATLAFATNCQNDQVDRPTVGYTGICFGALHLGGDGGDASTKIFQRQILTLAHEFTHVLGMSSLDIPYYYSHATGKPRTPRDQWNRPPQQKIMCVDGSQQSFPVPSEDTLKRVSTANGFVAYEVVTETVRNVARNQFNCQEMTGARLENQPTAEGDCYGSHWEHKLFNSEYMAAVYTGSDQYITALTLALLEDSGWYIPNYEVAQNSPWGLGAGCEFVEEQCIQDGDLPKWAEGTFCNDKEKIGCTPDRQIIALCSIAAWSGNLPEGYQYFEDPSVGGALQQMEFCPAYSTIYRFELGDSKPTLDCTDPGIDGTWVEITGEVFGKDSRCIESASGPRPLCLKVTCGENGEDRGAVVFEAKGEKIKCTHGETLKLPDVAADVICPSFEQICPDSVCPANCAGRGVCDFTLSPAQCKCFDKGDTSPFCEGSPSSFTSTETVTAAPTQMPIISAVPTPSSLAAPTPSSSHPTTGPMLDRLPTSTDIEMVSTNAPTSKAPTSDSPSMPLGTGSPFAPPPQLTTAPVSPSVSTDSPTIAPATKPSVEGAQAPGPSAESSCMKLQPGSIASLFIGLGTVLWLV